MQYKWWVIALYNEYCIREKELKKDKRKKITLKKFFKSLLEKENRLMLIFMVCVLIISILFIIGIIEPVKYWILLFSTEMLFLLPESYRNSKKIRLSHYREDINILIDILIKENLYDIDIINRLLEDTGGVFYKVKNGKMGYLKSIIVIITSIPVTLGFKAKLNLELKAYALILFIIIFIVVFIIWINYIVKELPFTDSYKKDQLHERLKIVLMYKLAEESKKDKQKRRPLRLKKG